MKISVMKRADAKKENRITNERKKQKSKSTIFPVCRLRKQKRQKETQNIIQKIITGGEKKVYNCCRSVPIQ